MILDSKADRMPCRVLKALSVSKNIKCLIGRIISYQTQYTVNNVTVAELNMANNWIGDNSVKIPHPKLIIIKKKKMFLNAKIIQCFIVLLLWKGEINHLCRIRRLVFTVRFLDDALCHVIIKIFSGPMRFVEMFHRIRQPRYRGAHMTRFRGASFIEHDKHAFHFGYYEQRMS